MNSPESTSKTQDVQPATSQHGGMQAVAVIHGLGSSRLLMLPLVYRLKSAGFDPKNFGYSSFFKSIDEHAVRFGSLIDQLDRDPSFDRIHIVAHSMGSIVTRALLEKRCPNKLHRVLMLAPPNLGSPAATRLSRILPLSTTVKQLSDRPNSYVNRLGPTRLPDQIEVGVIAASYDFVVSRESSRLELPHQHKTVFSGHNGLLVRKRAAAETIQFLKTGSFLPSEAGQTAGNA